MSPGPTDADLRLTGQSVDRSRRRRPDPRLDGCGATDAPTATDPR